MTDLNVYNPDTPGPTTEVSAWDMLERQANVLASSTIVPRQYQDRPGDIVAASMMGRELGWQPMTSLRLIHVVEGRPEISAEGMVALIRQAGHSVTGEIGADKAVVRGKRRDNGDEMVVEFTQEDANRAGLAGKQNWKRYPQAMLWARAVSQLKRMLFADVAIGVSYVEGEISGGDMALGELVPPPPVDVYGPDGRLVEVTGPTVYAADEQVEALLALCKGFDQEQKEAFYTEAETVEGRARGYSWSFRSEHHWTKKELADCKAFTYSLLGLEPWEDADGATVGADPETGEVVERAVVAGPVTPVVLQEAMVRCGWTVDSVSDLIESEFGEGIYSNDPEEFVEAVCERQDIAGRLVAMMDAQRVAAGRGDLEG